MPRDLIHLIKASGFAGVSGQNFLGHVTGAASGVGCDAKDYYVTAWTRDQDAPGNDGEDELTSPQSFVLTYQLTKGSHFHHIQRTDSGSVGVFLSSGGVGVPTASATLSSIAITSTQVGYTLNVAAKARDGAGPTSSIASWQNPGVWGAGKWFRDYSYPTLAPVGTAEPILFILDSVSAAGSPTSQVYDVDVHYIPDNGPYNSTLGETYHLLMEDRTPTIGDFDIQWSNDGSTVAGTGISHERAQTVSGESFSVWYRFRYVGGSSYGAWQQVQWTDPRV